MKNILFLLLFGAVLLAPSCDRTIDDDDPQDNCPTVDFDELSVTALGDTALPSSRVRVLFRVSNKDGEPIPDLTAANFSILEKGSADPCFEAIDPFEASRQIVKDPQVFRHNTILVLDLSKSITQSFLNELKTAAKSFVENVMPDTASSAYQMSIWWFDGSPQTYQLQDYTSDKTDLLAAIDGITADLCIDCNSTNLYGTVVNVANEALAQYNTSQQDGIIAGAAIVIFTDGDDQAGLSSLSLANAAIANAKNKTRDNVKVFSVGLGSEADLQNLKSIGQDGFSFTADQAELEQKFQETADDVRNEANSYYIFEYCSPKRAGKVGLKIQATGPDGKKGTLTYEFNAGVFTAPFSCQ